MVFRSWRTRWHQVTPFLVFCVFAFVFGDLVFGIDTGSFGSIQVLPSWLSTFGVHNAKTGKFTTPTSRTSIMNGVVFIGKLVGTLLFEPLAERLGYKKVMYIVAVVQCVGLIIELTAHNWIVFTVGRVFAYLAVGLVENCVPSYVSEIAPASIRGFLSGLMIVSVSLGNLWGAGMSRGFVNETRKRGWQIPVAVQLIPAVGLFALVPFTPESPRWLVAKGRTEEGLQSLNRVRPVRDVVSGVTDAEINAFQLAVATARTQKQGSWFDLARGTFRRRAWVIALLFWFYESTGTQFSNTYGPTFYTEVGLGVKAFTYATVTQTVGIVATIIAILCTDQFGRRPPIIVGAALCVLFNCLIAGIGAKSSYTTAQINTVIASVMLVGASSKMFQISSFLMASEIGGITMRKKFMGFGTSVDVVSAFIVTFCLPYLLKTPGANLGPKVGWIMAGDSLFALIFAVFFVPEIAGRSLEEMDELFEIRLWAWQFKKAKTSGVGRQIAELEEGHAVGKDDVGEFDDGMNGKRRGMEHVELQGRGRPEVS